MRIVNETELKKVIKSHISNSPKYVPLVIFGHEAIGKTPIVDRVISENGKNPVRITESEGFEKASENAILVAAFNDYDNMEDDIRPFLSMKRNVPLILELTVPFEGMAKPISQAYNNCLNAVYFREGIDDCIKWIETSGEVEHTDLMVRAINLNPRFFFKEKFREDELRVIAKKSLQKAIDAFKAKNPMEAFDILDKGFRAINQSTADSDEFVNWLNNALMILDSIKDNDYIHNDDKVNSAYAETTMKFFSERKDELE